MTAAERARAGGSGAARAVLAAVLAAALAAVLALSGLMACVLPSSTWLLSSAFSDDATSPYSRAQLVETALATRDYTAGSHDRESLDEALAALPDGLSWSGTCRDENGVVRSLPAPEPSRLDETLTLTDDAISHLDDVWLVLQPVYAAYLAALALAAACAIALARQGARRALRLSLGTAGVAVLAAFLAFGLWAAVDFNGMFAAFHSLFFAAGSWTFSYDSLLICMYPVSFWIGMAAVWLLVTASFSAGCLLAARALRPRRP